MGFSGEGAIGAIENYDGAAMRLARDLRVIQNKRGYLSYEQVLARGWTADELADNLSTALKLLRNMCRSHWPTCPPTIVVDAELSLLLATNRGEN